MGCFKRSLAGPLAGGEVCASAGAGWEGSGRWALPAEVLAFPGSSKRPPGGALTPRVSAAPRHARAISPSPPAGGGVDHSDPGPADRWRTGDRVPGVGSLPGVLQFSDPALALFSPPCSSPLKILRCNSKEHSQMPFFFFFF